MDYQQQAIEFLNDNNLTLKITKATKTIGEMSGKSGLFADSLYWNKHNKYRFTLNNKATGQRYSSIYWGSVNDYTNNIEPSAYDVLSCLECYCEPIFKDFCDCFGYDVFIENDRGYMVRNSAAYKTFKAVTAQANSLNRVLTEDQIEAMQEIR